MKAIRNDEAKKFYEEFRGKYEIEFAETKCNCGETQGMDVIDPDELTIVCRIPICDNCADRYAINELKILINKYEEGGVKCS